MLSLSLRVYRVCAHRSFSLAHGEEGGFSCPGQDEEGDLSEGGRVTLTQGSQLWVTLSGAQGTEGAQKELSASKEGRLILGQRLLQTLPCLGQMKLPFPLSH